MRSVQPLVNNAGPNRSKPDANSVILSCLSAHGIPAREVDLDVHPNRMHAPSASMAQPCSSSSSSSRSSSLSTSPTPSSSVGASPSHKGACDTSPTLFSAACDKWAPSPYQRRSRRTALPINNAVAAALSTQIPPKQQTSIFTFASSFQTLLHSQAPVSDAHSAFSELLSVSESSLPPSTLPIPHLSIPDLLPSDKSFLSSSTLTTLRGPAMGLDLLSKLAEEMDCDPRHAPTAASSAEQCHERQHIPKLWADQIFDSLGLTEIDPPKKHNTALELARISRLKRDSSTQRTTSLFKHSEYLDTIKLTHRTAVFFERLYQPLCADIFPRAYIYPRLGRKVQTQDPTFAALVLSMSVLGLLPLQFEDQSIQSTKLIKKIKNTVIGSDRLTPQLARPFIMPSLSGPALKPKLEAEAIAMITEALAHRSLCEGSTSFGERPTLESLMTSFFISIALYSLHSSVEFDEKWEQASFFRFCEAVTLAKLMRLDILGVEAVRHDSFALSADGSSEEEQIQHRRCLKVWAMLVRAEQWWARHRPGYSCQLQLPQLSITSAAPILGKRIINNEEDTRAKRVKSGHSDSKVGDTGPLDVLLHLGFPSLHQNHQRDYGHLLPCLQGRCSGSNCKQLTAASAIQMHDSLAGLGSPSIEAKATEVVLLDLARQLLRCRLWLACETHDLVDAHYDGPLRTDLVLHVSLDILDLLDDLHSLVLQNPAMAQSRNRIVAGTVTNALKEIRAGIVHLSISRYAADPFLFDEEDDSLSSTSSSSRQSKTPPQPPPATTTTIGQGCRAILVDLDNFLHQLL